MIRIANTNIPMGKKIHKSLTYVVGIGNTTSLEICKKASIDPLKKTKDLNSEEVSRIVKACSEYKLNEECIKETINNIQRLIAIKCNRGIRHVLHLPVRGQNTHSNAKTCKRTYLNFNKKTNLDKNTGEKNNSKNIKGHDKKQSK